MVLLGGVAKPPVWSDVCLRVLTVVAGNDWPQRLSWMLPLELVGGGAGLDAGHVVAQA